jgi:glycosyltransferase involved in cell wall biosynthesis
MAALFFLYFGSYLKQEFVIDVKSFRSLKVIRNDRRSVKLMHVCFLSYSHPYDDSRIFHKEAYSLVQAGYTVSHLCPGNGESHHELGINVVTYDKNNKGIIGRLMAFYKLYRKATELNGDCYHCNEVVFDVHEHYPSRASEPHFPKWFRWIGGPAVHFIFRVLSPYTDFFVFAKQSVAPDFKRYINKSIFLFNYAPMRMKARLDVPSLEIMREIGDGITAIHIGVMSRARGWPQLLEALAKMKCRHLNVLLLGSISEGEKDLMDDAMRLGVAHRVRLKSTVPYEHVFEYLKYSKVGLMLYQPGILNHVYAFPIKLYDYMLAGIPVIAPDFAVEVEPVVRQENCGLLVNTANSDQIAQALDWFCENLSEAQQMGLRGSRAVVDKYNWDNEKKKLLSMYDNLR